MKESDVHQSFTSTHKINGLSGAFAPPMSNFVKKSRPKYTNLIIALYANNNNLGKILSNPKCWKIREQDIWEIHCINWEYVLRNV